MEKLKKDLEHIKAAGIDSGALYKRVCKYLAELVAYKDTGLTPENVEKLKAEADFDHLKEIWGETPAKVEFGISFDRLLELVQAKRDGRLVVLPCMVGDTVYQTDGVRVYESRITRVLFDTAGVAFDEQAIGKTVFLTRQEAEAALERMKGEGEHG